jgi:hypothetical protein
MDIKEVEYNRLSILLQIIESYTILDCVCQQVISTYPDLPFITKHDSLLPVEKKSNGNRYGFETLVSGTIEQVLGIKPTLRWKEPRQV